jgi:hypothetical protein
LRVGDEDENVVDADEMDEEDIECSVWLWCWWWLLAPPLLLLK